ASAGTSSAGSRRSGCGRSRPRAPRFSAGADGWSRASGRRTGPATEAEIDDRRLGGLRLGVEELPRLEAERAGDEVARDRRDRRVVVEDGRVVVLPAKRDLVLGRRQLLLELEDVLVGLQLGIVLDDGEQRSECARERVLGLGLGGGALGA